MTLTTAIGTFLIAAGPVTALFLALLRAQPHLLVISICSAFTWCLSMILAGALWLAVVPLKQTYPWVLFLAVTFQELFRLLLYLTFYYIQTIDDGIKSFLRTGTKNRILTGVSVGIGFSALGVLINYFTLLVDFDVHDTAIYIEMCPNINFWVAGGSLALAYSVLHIVLGVLVWEMYVEKKWAKVGGVYVLHLAIAELGLGSRVRNGCQWTIPVVFIVVGILTVFTVFVCRKRIAKGRQEP